MFVLDCRRAGVSPCESRTSPGFFYASDYVAGSLTRPMKWPSVIHVPIQGVHSEEQKTDNAPDTVDGLNKHSNLGIVGFNQRRTQRRGITPTEFCIGKDKNISKSTSIGRINAVLHDAHDHWKAV